MKWEDLKWSTKQRIKFLDTRLFWEGEISRKDLTDFYNISIPQATKDFKLYSELAPGNMRYDNSEKKYIASPNFKPIIETDSEEYFSKLLTADTTDGKNRFYCGIVPPYYAPPCIGRKVESNILKAILKSIKEKNAIEIEYQSMNNPEPSWRWISPHAIGFDGFRWHARALCHNSKMYKDFNLGRISSVRNEKSFSFDHSNDFLWHHNITFQIGPHPGLSEGQKKYIEHDYGMINGELNFDVKASFMFYVIQRLGLDDGHKKRPAKQQQIILLNADEINRKKEVLESIVSTKLNEILGE